jgi:hypothetical protein
VLRKETYQDYQSGAKKRENTKIMKSVPSKENTKIIKGVVRKGTYQDNQICS